MNKGKERVKIYEEHKKNGAFSRCTESNIRVVDKSKVIDSHIVDITKRAIEDNELLVQTINQYLDGKTDKSSLKNVILLCKDNIVGLKYELKEVIGDEQCLK